MTLRHPDDLIHESFICVMWRIHIWNLRYYEVWYDLIHESFTCDMTHPSSMNHSHEWYDTFIYETWGMGWLRLAGSIKLQVSFAEYYRSLLQNITFIYDITRPSYMSPSHDTFTLSYVWYDTSIYVICDTIGWIRWVRSLKTHTSFAKKPYKRDDILQKRPIFWKSLLIVATPSHLKVVIDLHMSFFAKEPYLHRWFFAKEPYLHRLFFAK